MGEIKYEGTDKQSKKLKLRCCDGTTTLLIEFTSSQVMALISELMHNACFDYCKVTGERLDDPECK
jgi:hypothetical protein